MRLDKIFKYNDKTLATVDIIWRNVGISRNEIGKEMQMSKGAVATNINRMLKDGYIYEGPALSSSETPGVGRTPNGLYLKPDLFYTLGVLLYADYSEIVLLDAQNKVCDRLPLTGYYEHHQVLLESIRNNGKKLLTKIPKEKLLGVGMAISGTMDCENGVVCHCPELKDGDNLDLKDFIYKNFKVPFYIINTGQLTAAAEKLYGSAKDMSDFVVINEYFGAGLFLDGKLYRGWQKGAGEFGYMKYSDSNAIGPDGRNGSLIAKNVRIALLHKIFNVIKFGSRTFLSGRKYQKAEDIHIDDVVDAIEKGDTLLANYMAQMFEEISENVLNVAYLLNPQAIFLRPWTARCPECSIDVVKRKMGHYGVANSKLDTEILSSNVDVKMFVPAVTDLLVRDMFAGSLNKKE